MVLELPSFPSQEDWLAGKINGGNNQVKYQVQTAELARIELQQSCNLCNGDSGQHLVYHISPPPVRHVYLSTLACPRNCLDRWTPVNLSPVFCRTGNCPLRSSLIWNPLFMNILALFAERSALLYNTANGRLYIHNCMAGGLVLWGRHDILT